MRWRLSVCLWALLCASSSANEFYRPRAVSELHKDHYKQHSVWVDGARVAYLNVAALKRDFPQLEGFSYEQLEGWVLKNFAYMSVLQLSLNGFRNTPIPFRGDVRKIGYRPPTYGRAAVYEARLGDAVLGLVDVKGCGNSHDRKVNQQLNAFSSAANQQQIDKLRVSDHSDGLMSLGEAIAETTRQIATQMLFDMHNVENRTNFQTVETYFVIALPFRILKDHGHSIPAALYGRQAHWGRGNSNPVPSSILVDYHGGNQRSYTHSAIDFGGVLIRDKRLAHNFGVLWGDGSDPQSSKPWAWGHDTAEAFVRGDTNAVYRHIDEMVGPIKDDWEKVRESARALSEKNAPKRAGLLGAADLFHSDNVPLRYAADSIFNVVDLDNKAEVQNELIEKFKVTADPQVREQILTKFANVKVEDPKVRAVLIDAVDDPAPNVRRRAAIVLPTIFPQDAATMNAIKRARCQSLLTDP